jgi:Ca-activated chloride channel family protein
MTDPLFTVDIQSSRVVIPSVDVPQLVYLLIDIRPPQDRDLTSLPLNLCIVIDRSSSMRGDRLDHVRAATSAVLEKLSGDDMVSIVTFSDSAEVIFPVQHISSKAEMLSVLNSINAAGGTEMLSGLRYGFNQMERVPLETHNNHLLLLTDGHTYGDENACIDLVHSAADNGIDFSAFGIGSEWNDRFLDSLVSYSGGQSIFVESPEKVISSMQRRFEGIGRIYAQNVRLVADFPDEITLKSAYKVTPFSQSLSQKDIFVNFGAVEGRRTLSVLLEFLLDSQPAGATVSIPLLLLADIPSQLIRDRELKLRYHLEVVAEEPELKPPQEMINAVQAMNFHKMNEIAWQEIQDGDIQKATIRLQTLATRLLEAGHAGMAQRVFSEAERVMTWGSMSGEGRKALKYGTQALMSESKAFKAF